jgi:hypothetical protein
MGRSTNNRPVREGGPRLLLEPLETRRLLAGDVVLTLADGSLKVDGDEADNAIRISTRDGMLSVAAADDDTLIRLRNSATPATVVDLPLADLTGSIHVRLRDGDDSVAVGGEDSADHTQLAAMAVGEDHADETGLVVPRDLTVNAGSGDNSVRVSFTQVGGMLFVRASHGQDTVVVGRGRGFGSDDHHDDGGCGGHAPATAGELTTSEESGGCGDDSGGPPPDVVVGERLRIQTNGGNDAVKVSFTQVGRDLSILTGQEPEIVDGILEPTREDADLVVVGRGPMFRRDDPGGGHQEVITSALAEDTCTDGCGDDGGHDSTHGDGGPPPDVRVGRYLQIDTADHDDKVKVAFAEVTTDVTISVGAGDNIVVTGRGPIFGRHGSGGGHDGAVESSPDGTGGDGHAGRRPVDLSVGGGLTATGASGDDLFMLRNTAVSASVTLATGTGDDSLGVQNLRVAGSTSIQADQGSNLVALLDSVFAGDLSVTTPNTSANGDLLVLDLVHVHGRLDVSTGVQDRLVMRDSVFADAVTVNLGPDQDLLAADGNQFQGAATFDGGGGPDSLFLPVGEDRNMFLDPSLTTSFEVMLSDFDFAAILAEVEGELAGFLQGRA